MIAGQTDNTARETSPTTVRRIFYFVLPVLIIVGALIAYKSSTALGVIGKGSATGVFNTGANVIARVAASDAGVLRRTPNSVLVIWPGLVLGVLISAAVSTVAS